MKEMKEKDSDCICNIKRSYAFIVRNIFKFVKQFTYLFIYLLAYLLAYLFIYSFIYLFDYLFFLKIPKAFNILIKIQKYFEQ